MPKDITKRAFAHINRPFLGPFTFKLPERIWDPFVVIGGPNKTYFKYGLMGITSNCKKNFQVFNKINNKFQGYFHIIVLFWLALLFIANKNFPTFRVNEPVTKIDNNDKYKSKHFLLHWRNTLSICLLFTEMPNFNFLYAEQYLLA